MQNRFLTICLFLFCKTAFAQTAVNNSGILYIKTSSDILYITGNFTNSSSSSLTNNGNLYVKGNLNNDQASMTVGTGTLFMNGSSSQTVSGSQKFNTYNLQTDNSSDITLNNDLSVSGAHTFTAGKIITSATPNYLIYKNR